MIIMRPGATQRQVDGIARAITEVGLRPMISEGANQTIIGIIGDESRIDFDRLGAMPGVREARPIQVPYKLVSREYMPEEVVVNVGGVSIGGASGLVVMAGPCSIEDQLQILRIGAAVKVAGAQILRGGAFKPRKSMHTFEGHGEQALEYLREAGQALHMPTVTEVMDPRDVPVVAAHVDILQIGARSMYNKALIEEAAATGKPVLFKRAPSASVKEWLGWSERVVGAGNTNLIFCERGIGEEKDVTTTQARYVFDGTAITIVRTETPFPVIGDPSHATGMKGTIGNMALAAVGAGAHGLMLEVHDKPWEALSDGPQAISPEHLAKIIRAATPIAEIARELFDARNNAASTP